MLEFVMLGPLFEQDFVGLVDELPVVRARLEVSQAGLFPALKVPADPGVLQDPVAAVGRELDEVVLDALDKVRD